MTRMAEWKRTSDLEDHYRAHHRLLNVTTVADYEASAKETIGVGTYFEYRDPETREWRVGYYDRPTRRFTATNGDDEIVTHFRCIERYVRRLPRSTYA